ncbi:MAG: TetR/AcrR family transcriptional regulator [Anaerolineae bacterium]|nr:TetR/AcrR family transcriptional regulator [Anaerolineae bacterium]
MSNPDTKRGRSHNAAGAREAILNAAEAVFASHGFDGTRVDAIAEEAGYNKSLIFQYFGDKLKLYESVLRRADEQFRGFQNQMFSELAREETMTNPDQLKSLFRSFLNAYFDYLVAHPAFVRILNWELAEGWVTYAQIASERDRDEMSALNAVLQTVQASGWLRSNITATSQFMLGLFTSQLYLSLIPLFKAFLPATDWQSQIGLAQSRDFIVGFVMHGLLTDADEPQA